MSSDSPDASAGGRAGLPLLGLVALSATLACAPAPEARAQSADDPAKAKFVSAAVCSDCHSRLYPPGQEADWDGMNIFHHDGTTSPVDPDSVAPYALWSASMMAHAAKDPYWLAKVRFESAKTPAASAVIEDTCLSCHAPTQQYEFRALGRPMRLDELAGQGLEGVACTSCHQISPDNLGTAESFTAGFKINDEKRIYGPHQDPFPMPMRMHTGRTPTYSEHMLESALCGTCHTVITPTLNAEGEATGRFLEQATYLEWLASDYAADNGKTCQSCHMPALTDEQGNTAKQYIAHTPHGGFFGPSRPREPFGQHSFLGANVQGLAMLAELFPEEKVILDRAGERARKNLESAAGLKLSAEASDGSLTTAATIVNRAGHKLPSGFPSRRVWLHLKVSDASGETVFESGDWDPVTGELRAGGAVQPHRQVITAPSEVAVYESEMADSGHGRSISLLRAAHMLKDNRILPRGFNADRAQVDGIEDLSTAPVGVEGDADFAPGSDAVRYAVDLKGSQGPWTVQAELLYQSIKPEHTSVLRPDGSREEKKFLSLYESYREPTVMATQEIAVP